MILGGKIQLSPLALLFVTNNTSRRMAEGKVPIRRKELAPAFYFTLGAF